jgi:hypothetical protein
MPGDGGEPSDGGEPGTGGTMAGSGGAASGAGGMAGKAGGGGSGGGAITCPTIANFDEDWAARVCGKNEDCCAASTPTTCVSDAQAGIIQLYPSLEASIAAGTAQFNCDDYVACMTAVNMASCTNWPKEMSVDFGLPVNEPKCRTFIRGTIASGNGTGAGACTQNYQCIDGYCTDPDGTAGAQVTQCVAFAPTNDTCGTGQPTDVCNPITHFCDASVMPNLCRTRSPNGVACTAANQCESRVCSTTCQPAAPAACPWIPTPPSCSVSNVGAHTGSLGWLAIAGFIGFGAMGRRRRRR